MDSGEGAKQGEERTKRATLDTASVMRVAQIFAEKLRTMISTDPSLGSRYVEGDEDLEHQMLRAACAVAGVEIGEYQSAVSRDSNLVQLHHWAVTEAICGTSDPGPYDQISRESASGTENNEHLHPSPLGTPRIAIEPTSR